VITPTLGLLFASWPEFIKPGISLFNQWQSFFNFSLTSALNGCRIKQAHLAINRRQRKKNKRNVDLYSAFTATPPQGAQVWITVLPPNCRRKWRITNSDLCPWGETQMIFHIVESCPLTKLNGGLSRLHFADEDAVSWLTNYGSWHIYEKEKHLQTAR